VNALAAAPDGSWLAAGGADGQVRVWDPLSCTLRSATPVPEDYVWWMLPVRALAVAPDGSWLASGCCDNGMFDERAFSPDGGAVRISDPRTGAITAILGDPGSPVGALATAPDGSWLAVGSYDGTVRVWDPLTWHNSAVLEGHDNQVNALAVAPDGSWLASASDDQTVRIWDCADPGGRPVLAGRAHRVAALAAAPDGSWLVSAGDPSQDRGTVMRESAYLWNPQTGESLVALPGHYREVTALAAAPDGSWLASASVDKIVRVCDPRRETCLRLSPDPSELRFWHDTEIVLAGHTGPVTALAAGPDGSWLASGSRDKTVRLWDPRSGECRAVLTGTGAVTALAAASDGAWLASGSKDGKVCVWDPAAAGPRAVLAGHARRVMVMAAAPDGTWGATPSRDATVRVWDPQTWECRSVLAGSARFTWVLALAAAPDGAWLASAGHDAAIRVWDPLEGTCRATLVGHAGPVRALAAAPDGTWLASAGSDGTIRVWNPMDAQQLAVIRTSGRLTCCQALPRQHTLIVGGDTRLYLLDVRQRQSTASPTVTT
jgi:WD40 repeat protein